jgi:hypothetical protein
MTTRSHGTLSFRPASPFSLTLVDLEVVLHVSWKRLTWQGCTHVHVLGSRLFAYTATHFDNTFHILDLTTLIRSGCDVKCISCRHNCASEQKRNLFHVGAVQKAQKNKTPDQIRIQPYRENLVRFEPTWQISFYKRRQPGLRRGEIGSGPIVSSPCKEIYCHRQKQLCKGMQRRDTVSQLASG